MGQLNGFQDRRHELFITLQMLVILLQALVKIFTSNYAIHILNAAFCLDFLFCLRVGNLPNKLLKGNDPQPLRRNEIVIVKVDEQRQVTLTIWQSKTDQLGQSTDLFFVGNRGYGLSLRFSNKYPGVQIRLNFWFIFRFIPWCVISSHSYLHKLYDSVKSFALWFISFPMATIDTQFLKAEGWQVIRHPTITFVKKQLFVNFKIGHVIISWVIQHCSIVCRESWDFLGTSTGFTVFPDEKD